jgi:hypothetical protein
MEYNKNETAIDICHKWISFFQPRVGYVAPQNIIRAMEEYAKVYNEEKSVVDKNLINLFQSFIKTNNLTSKWNNYLEEK